MLKTYLVTSPSSCGCEVGGREGNSNFNPPVGFDMTVTVTVLVELVCGNDVGVTSALVVLVLAFVRDVLDAPIAEVA